MTPTERLQAAIDKLEQVRNETVEAGKVTTETAVIALRMVIPVLRMLRHDLAMLATCDGDLRAKVISAAERAGDLALADAILGGAE